MKYKILKELINERIESSKESLNEAKRFGSNSCGACMYMGEIEALHDILSYIEKLESKDLITD